MSGVAPVEYDFMGLEKGGASAGFQPPVTSPVRRQFSHHLFSGRLLETLLASGAAAATAETYGAGTPKCTVSNPVPCSTPVSPPSPAADTRRWSSSPMPVMSPASRYPESPILYSSVGGQFLRPPPHLNDLLFHCGGEKTWSLRSAVGSPPTGAAAPLTIFYNGTVFVFDLPPQKAEAIIRWLQTAFAEMKRRTEGRADGIAAAAGDRCQELQQQESPSLLEAADVPLARRRSLLRFMERRKERMTVMPPCLSSNSSSIECAGETSQEGHGQRRKRQKLEG